MAIVLILCILKLTLNVLNLKTMVLLFLNSILDICQFKIIGELDLFLLVIRVNMVIGLSNLDFPNLWIQIYSILVIATICFLDRNSIILLIEDYILLSHKCPA